MARYIIELADQLNKVEGISAYIVEALTADHAKHIAAAQHSGDAPWLLATATDITATAAPDLAGWRYRVRLSLPLGGEPDILDVSYTAVASDTADLIGAALVPLINAHPLINGAAYDSGTNVLTVTSIGDNLGDRTLRVEAYPPNAKDPAVNNSLVTGVSLPGAANTALVATLAQPSPIPSVIRRFK